MRLRCGSLFLALLCVGGPAAAQNDADKATASALFKEAKALFAEKRVGEACAKFEESLRLELAGGTVLNLAVCHETLGKTATAWAEFQQALSLAKRDGRDDRIVLAQEALIRLEPRLVRLRFEVPPTHLVPGLTLSRNGSELRQPAWSTAIPVDPGEHTIEAKAPGYRPWLSKVNIVESTTLTVPLLERLPAPVGIASAGPLPTVALGPSLPQKAQGWSTLRTTGVVWLGVSAVGLGFGSYFGLQAFQKRRDSDAFCPTSQTCSDKGVDLNNQAKLAADVSTSLFLIGGLGAGLGAFFLVQDARTAGSGALAVAPTVGRGVVGLHASRGF